VVHRDIKPENLLLTTDGSILVADFGIARALASVDDRLTETGLAVGTPAYMSPEQAAGDRTVDARTDVYSLGAVLYEMLAGEPPFTGPTAQAVIAKRFSGEAPRFGRRGPSVPEQVDTAVARALAPVAADRFDSVEDFARALGGAPRPAPPSRPHRSRPCIGRHQCRSRRPRRPGPSRVRRRMPLAATTLILGFLVGLGVLFAWRRRAIPGRMTAPVPSDSPCCPSRTWATRRMPTSPTGSRMRCAEALAGVGLAVIAGPSSNEYRHTTKAPAGDRARARGRLPAHRDGPVGEKPGAPNRVRVSPELIRVDPGAAPITRWQQPFDASLTDVFQVRRTSRRKWPVRSTWRWGDSVRHELAAKPTENLAAYDAYLKGEAVSQGMAAGDPASLRRAIGFYQQATDLDPGFLPPGPSSPARKPSCIATVRRRPSWPPRPVFAADRAQALGPGRPEGQTALGDYHRYVTIDNRQSRAAYEAGLKLAPANVDLLVGAALTEQGLGYWEAALQHLTQAAALDPRSANTARRIAATLLWLRRYPEAQVALDRALALAPTNLNIIEMKAQLALGQGDLAGARAVVRAALQTIDSAAVLFFFANYWDLFWVLDDAQQQQLLALPPSAFDNDRGAWAIVRAQTYWLRNDPAKAKVYADSAQLAMAEQLRATPDNDQRHVLRGLALAYLGRKAEAIQEGERGVAIMPVGRDAFGGAYDQHQLVRIYLLTGEPEKALDQLEPLLKIPYFLSPGLLRIDPYLRAAPGQPALRAIGRRGLTGHKLCFRWSSG
jgi:serine/threonine-protein kinase